MSKKIENLHLNAEKLEKVNSRLKQGIYDVKEELERGNKALKTKEKDVVNIMKRFENSQEVTKNLKSEKEALNVEKAKIESELKKKEKIFSTKATRKSVDTQTEAIRNNQTETIRNNLLIASSSGSFLNMPKNHQMVFIPSIKIASPTLPQKPFLAQRQNLLNKQLRNHPHL